MTISPSTAQCERGFSCMNREKTVLRTGLNEATLDAIMKINVDGPTTEEFNPERFVNAWMESAKTTRHFCHKGPVSKKQKLE